MLANVIDMFHGDNNEAMPDFAAMKAAGVIAIAHKVSQSVTFRDPKFRDRIAAARSVGLIVGGYHFLVANFAMQQAQYFLNTVQDCAPLDFMACDYERSTHTPTATDAITWLEYVENRFGRPPLLYGGDLIRETIGPSPHIDWPHYPLWLAEYGPVEKIPRPWDAALFWQYSETGIEPGITGHVDLNYFNGSADDLRAALKVPT